MPSPWLMRELREQALRDYMERPVTSCPDDGRPATEDGECPKCGKRLCLPEGE